jgi:hypothetical protein
MSGAAKQAGKYSGMIVRDSRGRCKKMSLAYSITLSIHHASRLE